MKRMIAAMIGALLLTAAGVRAEDTGPVVRAAWAVFGVSETVTRLVPAALGTAAIGLTWSISRRLVPGAPGAAHRLAPVILVSLPLWTWWGAQVEYDLPMATSVLAAHGAGLAFACGGPLAWMLAAGAALGAGVLFKGPVVLVHVLPAWLAWAWWRPASGPRPGRWWAGVGIALALALAISLGWALSAAAAGGEAYGNKLLFGQTARRIGDHARHGRPWWWYGPVLLLVLMPWILRPGGWRRLIRARGRPDAPGGLRPWRYLAVWIGGGLLVLSAAGAKQPHYLIPLLPAFSIAMALSVAPGKPAERALDAWLPALFLAAVAGLLVAGPKLCDGRAPADVCGAIRSGWGVVPLAAGAVVVLVHYIRHRSAAVLGGCLVVVLLAVAAWARPVTDLERTGAMGKTIAAAHARGHAVAQLGRYQGQYHFAGRLRQPIVWFETPGELAAWARAHPEDYVLVYSHRPPGPEAAGATLVSPYRGHYAQLWPARAALQTGAIRHPDDPESSPEHDASS
ncbi:MAG: glycosyltransferase family 39 protein [Gammaproteobacteria bacterium]